MNVSPIPDYISPIVGYRVWDLVAARLWSLNHELWFPGRALTAKCPTTFHEPAAEGCSCGVYAAKNYQHLQKIAYRNIEPGVIGEAYLWGKVVEHDLGYRAQFAYPKSLVLPSNIGPRFRLEPLMVYGADISIASGSSKDQHILLWTNGSGYTPAGFDWLIENRKQWCKWCKQRHGRTLLVAQLHAKGPQPGDFVTVLGRGIPIRGCGWVKRDDGSSGYTSDNVCIGLMNGDLYIVPHQGIVWNCQNWRWEADPSGYLERMTLVERLGLLLQWLDNIGLAPPSRDIRIVEINSKTPWVPAEDYKIGENGLPLEQPSEMKTDHYRHRVRKDELLTPEEYKDRFNELLAVGYDWINMSCYGVQDGFLIVAIVVPGPLLPQGGQRKLFPGCATFINLSGPCNAVNWDVGWLLEVV